MGRSIIRQPGTSSDHPQRLSVLILTKNEENNIEDCLRCLSFSDDIVVLDSHSTDRTTEIVAGFPYCRIVHRQFDTEYKQRNFGLQEIEYKHPWVYICDADERVPQELAAELMRVVNDPTNPHVAFRLRYKNMFLGRWIKHASGYPVWLIRLVRPRQVTYEVRETNVHPIVQGTAGELRHHFIHYSFNSGLRRWFEKHNFYSTREAIEGVKVRRQGLTSWRHLWHADPMVRRRTMKNMSYFLRGRAFWRFWITFLFRGGWLDGMAGMRYAAMISMYEYWIELKIIEQQSKWRKRTNALVQKHLAPSSS